MPAPPTVPLPFNPTLKIGKRHVLFNDALFIPHGESARLTLPNGEAGELQLSLRFDPLESDNKGIRWGPIEGGTVLEIVIAGGGMLETITNDLVKIGDSPTHELFFIAGYTRSKSMDAVHFMLLTQQKDV